MDLYLIRHAHAVNAKENPQRPLSDRGRKQARALAKFLARGNAFQPAEIWHSSLVRSRETAALLGQTLVPAAALRSVTGLEPEDDPAVIARQLRSQEQSIALVGHEPHLSALATFLVTGSAQAPLFLLKKCSALRLEGLGAHWQVRWQISPELLA